MKKRHWLLISIMAICFLLFLSTFTNATYMNWRVTFHLFGYQKYFIASPGQLERMTVIQLLMDPPQDMFAQGATSVGEDFAENTVLSAIDDYNGEYSPDFTDVYWFLSDSTLTGNRVYFFYFPSNKCLYIYESFF